MLIFFVTCKSFEEDYDAWRDLWRDLSGEGGEDVNGEDVNNISDIIDDIMEENQGLLLLVYSEKWLQKKKT